MSRLMNKLDWKKIDEDEWMFSMLSFMTYPCWKLRRQKNEDYMAYYLTFHNHVNDKNNYIKVYYCDKNKEAMNLASIDIIGHINDIKDWMQNPPPVEESSNYIYHKPEDSSLA